MKTKNSIMLEETQQRCFARSEAICCTSLIKPEEQCGSYRCPFYKPQGCKDWIRIDDEDGCCLIPPEEYYASRRRKISWG